LQEEILKGLSDSVLNMEEEKAIEFAHRAVSEHVDAFLAIDKGLSDGMRRAGGLYEQEDYFIPELLLCADALNAGVDILKPHIKIDAGTGAKKRIVIGVIEGDTHDIGKNLVKIMVETGGYEVFDIGRDASPEKFVNTAIEKKADIIAVSTLMTTTMPGMKLVIDILTEKNIRNDFKVIIGGGPISQNYADRIGADGYSSTASDALRLVERLVKT
jgi:corrinoid protein of di/trimethylamine methyltransferase